MCNTAYEFLAKHRGTRQSSTCHRSIEPRREWRPVVRAYAPSRHRGRTVHSSARPFPDSIPCVDQPHSKTERSSPSPPRKWAFLAGRWAFRASSSPCDTCLVDCHCRMADSPSAFRTWWRQATTNRKPDRNRFAGTLRAQCSLGCRQCCRRAPVDYVSSFQLVVLSRGGCD